MKIWKNRNLKKNRDFFFHSLNLFYPLILSLSRYANSHARVIVGGVHLERRLKLPLIPFLVAQFCGLRNTVQQEFILQRQQAALTRSQLNKLQFHQLSNPASSETKPDLLQKSDPQGDSNLGS